MNILENRYEIEKEVGRGGTSVVYKAFDLEAENAVRAIKAISTSDPDVYDMAKRESQLIRELYEKDTVSGFLPNIIQRFERDHVYYIVQDYLDGETMDEMLNNSPMPYELFIESAKQICQFMSFFHSTGRVHSDMKPENIMVLRPAKDWNNGSGKNIVKLKFIDFGTAIRNETGDLCGYTPEYAAPEQFREQTIDKRTDVFNIGATFYHMITGKRPLCIYDPVMQRELTAEERFKFDKNINTAIRRIILKCVMDEPYARYQSCEEIYKDLMRIEKHFYIRLTAALYAAAAVFLIGFGVTACVSDSMTEKDKNTRYEQCYNAGDYQGALRIDHSNRDDIYFKLLDSFKADDKLDPEENNFIINEIRNRNDLNETDSDYGRIMFEIGNAYWLYYDPHTEGSALDELELEKDRITVSYEWFEKAVGSAGFAAADAERYTRAKIYYNIGKFYIEIDRKEREGTDDKEFYRTMWDSIAEMSGYISDVNEVVSARVCQTLASLISRYSAKFKQVGITEEQQSVILDQIVEQVYAADGSITYHNNYSIGIAQNIDVDAVRLKLSMTYADDGGGAS